MTAGMFDALRWLEHQQGPGGLLGIDKRAQRETESLVAAAVRGSIGELQAASRRDAVVVVAQSALGVGKDRQKLVDKEIRVVANPLGRA